MRLIDADEVLDSIKQLEQSPWYKDGEAAESDGLRRLEYLARREAVTTVRDLCVMSAPTALRWIPAEERLPDVAGRPVLVCTLDHYATWHTIIASIMQGGWWDGHTWRSTKGTCWMPLPEPPEEAAL